MGLFGSNKSTVENFVETNEAKTVLYLNKKSEKGEYPLTALVMVDNLEMIRFTIDYANKNSITLEWNVKDNKRYPLFEATYNDNTSIVKAIIDYATQKNIILDLNSKDTEKNFLFMNAVRSKNIKILQSLIEYADKNNFYESYGIRYKEKYYPLLCAVYKNNIDLVKLIMNYADRKRIPLILNDRNDFGEYPIEFEEYEIGEYDMQKLMKKDYTDYREEKKRINEEKEKKEKEEKEEKEKKEREEKEKKKGKEREERNNKEKGQMEKVKKVSFSSKIKSIIKNDDDRYTFIGEKYYEWKIRNWKELESEEYGPEFMANDYIWKLMIKKHNKDNDEKYINIGLRIFDDDVREPITSNFVIFIRNYDNDKNIQS
ncbi:hypothetical protein BCR32DRAFT_278763 [Anaeromyces robustus]|uniref:MATH domain-containing protein n=1 Tax=Anaeromyces robustus TaxID=1754192 RepID=A0A1Y1XB73_9FUNG|nr:hypothetical protein BCR32DRAFT_278763 [Anaeromyces robustus]|eukprot:ORX82614.1 hypothetical protein BCR32DRAFT_278763 [Anaeromyces robustus]